MRYTGSSHEISYAATLEFFEARGRGAQPNAPHTATMYQDESLAARRDAWEKATVVPLLSVNGPERVLDIGCGYGRWAQTLRGKFKAYLGVDFSTELLRLADAQKIPDAHFQRLAAQDIDPGVVAIAPPFDLCICSGILIYLNDSDVVKLAAGVRKMAAPRAQVYLREPMALAERLTLDRDPSSELQREYSAVYRTIAECRELFGSFLAEDGFELSVEKRLYPSDLCNRKETEQYIQIWTKS